MLLFSTRNGYPASGMNTFEVSAGGGVDQTKNALGHQRFVWRYLITFVLILICFGRQQGTTIIGHKRRLRTYAHHVVLLTIAARFNNPSSCFLPRNLEILLVALFG